MNPRGHMQPYLSNSLAIRQEIQRFESVHPSIYAIYDLIEAIPDPLIQQQVREHVVCIEDSFVNSQEWTLARSVPDIKLGIVGSINSGKSALVHRYLTGSYMQEESPEGGRFKKEISIDGQSYLLLIRDEGGSPEMQFTHWVDAVIFVFSLENETSFNAVYSYYAKMAHYRNTAEVPIILVGTQDAISESNPRLIDDSRARKLASDLKKCSYYETCATYGLNVERVFQDACQKIIQSRLASITPSNSRPSTPNHSLRGHYSHQTSTPMGYDTHSSSQSTSGSGNLPTATPSNSSHSIQGQNLNTYSRDTLPSKEKDREHRHEKRGDKHKHKEHRDHRGGHERSHTGQGHMLAHDPTGGADHQQEQLQVLHQVQQALQQQQEKRELHDLITPTSTPLSIRRNKKSYSVVKSNSFSGPMDAKELSLSLPRDPFTPSSTPILSRKNKNKHSIMSDDPNFSYTPNQTPHADRRGGGDRLSLIIHPDVANDHDFPDDTQTSLTHPITSLLNRASRVRASIESKSDGNDLLTPSSTPTQSRKNRRRSSLFSKKGDEDKKPKNGSDSLGSGRAIPIKQGLLYKRSSKGLNKEWKKKYVTLCDDGRLTYHPSLHDYMDDVHGKEITLSKTTVKIPGMFKPRAKPITNPNINGKSSQKDKENVMLTAYDAIRDSNTGQRLAGCDDAVVIPNMSNTPGYFNGLDPLMYLVNSSNVAGTKLDTPNVKKRHKRAKSGTGKNLDPSQMDDSDGYEFIIVSLENKQWHFEAHSIDDREDWVRSIEQQILCSLQSNESTKQKSRSNTMTDPSAVQMIRNVRGNNLCADCEQTNPGWASLNLGAIICIECSGIHRNIGTHVTRVRSLDLDEWTPDLVAVMTSIGNHVANTVWEVNTKGRPKPSSHSPREEKERWIRAKYENKEFLPPPPYSDIPYGQQLIDAVVRNDIRNLILVLAHCKVEHVNAPHSKNDMRTALHIAAAVGSVVLVQMLLWYGANVKMVDHEGRNAMWYARNAEAADCIELLKTNGCPEHPTLPRRRGSVQPSNEDVFDKLPASVL